MLYRPQPHIHGANALRLLLSAVAVAFISLFRQRRDVMYLDGMRQSELEELGLRRTYDGSYRPFSDGRTR